MNENAFEVLMCPKLLSEIRGALNRPKFERYLSRRDIVAHLEQITNMSVYVSDPIVIAPTTRDKKDDYLVALALENNAQCIVTGDKDLLEWRVQMPKTISPAAFERMIREL